MHKRKKPATSNGSSDREGGAQERGRLPADTVSTGRQWCQQKMFFENRDHFCPDLSSTVKQLWRVRSSCAVRKCRTSSKMRRSPTILRVMFIGTQVDTISCKGADSVCCPLSCVFSLFFIMREAGEIPRLRAAQCAAAPRPAPFRCPPCQCRGIRCGCSGGSCGSISPSARLPRSVG